MSRESLTVLFFWAVAVAFNVGLAVFVAGPVSSGIAAMTFCLFLVCLADLSVRDMRR